AVVRQGDGTIAGLCRAGQYWRQDRPPSVVRHSEPPTGITAVPTPVAKIPLGAFAADGSRYASQVDPPSAERSTQLPELPAPVSVHASQTSAGSCDTVHSIPLPSARA